jgi:Ser/Thr protein kinase RdoA (MazF antagonist)
MTVPAVVLRAWGLEGAKPEPILMGNINRTFRIGDVILQRLNPIFGPEVHDDIEAVTSHIEARGLRTPRLLRTTSGELWTTDDDGGVWRLQTFIDGIIITANASAGHCREAGRLLGAFHTAVADLDYTFSNRRPGVHDTERHRDHLAEVLGSHTGHGAFAEVEPVGRAILEMLDALPPATGLPPRIVHGDPKITNVVFDEQTALCFIDLDTFSRMTIPVELGDAFRSWCNTAGEDQTEARFDLDLFRAGIEGYADRARALLTAPEIDAIVPAVETIALELAARFCADALEESYFGWNQVKFPSASAHHLHRARGQLSLGRAIHERRADMEGVVRGLLVQ